MSSCNHPNHAPGYVFGSSIITLVIGSLSFIVALAWSGAVAKSFEKFESRAEELEARFSYAFLVTCIAIVVTFFAMYFICGERW